MRADAGLDTVPGQRLSNQRPSKPPGAADPIGFDAWLAQCRERGEKPIPPDDPVFAFAAKAGIPEAMLLLHWFAFKRRRANTRKRQAGVRGWRQTFRNSVEGNWFRLWSFDAAGVARLTSVGQAMQAVMASEQRGAAAPAQGDDR